MTKKYHFLLENEVEVDWNQPAANYEVEPYPQDCYLQAMEQKLLMERMEEILNKMTLKEDGGFRPVC